MIAYVHRKYLFGHCHVITLRFEIDLPFYPAIGTILELGGREEHVENVHWVCAYCKDLGYMDIHFKGLVFENMFELKEAVAKGLEKGWKDPSFRIRNREHVSEKIDELIQVVESPV